MKPTAMRDSFSDLLIQFGRENSNVIVLDGDVANSTKTDRFYEALPNQFVHVGIAEQNMVGIAAGLATVGLRPVVTTFAVFATSRAHDQIRMTVAQTELPVIIVGAYSGILAGKTGKTHICVDDLSVFRAMPNMSVAAPVDALDLERCLRRALAADAGPTYIRVARDGAPDVLPAAAADLDPVEPIVLRQGDGALALVSTGTQTARVVEAAERLAAEGIDASVIHVSMLKPLNDDLLLNVLAPAKLVITVEEHSVIGGLGGAVAELLSARHPKRLIRLGLQDTFLESADNDDLLEKYRLNAETVAEDVARIVAEEV